MDQRFLKGTMAHHKSALKRIRQNTKQNLRNRGLRSALRTTIKQHRSLLETGSAEEVAASLPGVQKALDKAVTKGVIHAGKAARMKSRLYLHLNKIQQTATVEA